MHVDELGQDLRPDPLLGAIDRYSGTFRDLDQNTSVGPAAFHHARQSLASRLRELGLDPGARVVLAVSNGAQFVASLDAILTCGGSPILTHSRTPAPELRRIALRFGASFVLGDTASNDEMLAVSLSAQNIVPADWLSLVWSTVDASDPAFDDRYPALPAVPLHQTSGTTGVPKVAIRPGAAAVAEAQHYIETTGIDHDDSIVVVSPMSHAYAYGMGVMVPMLSGADIVSMPEFKPNLLFDAFANEMVTVFPAVPAMLEVLLFGVGERLRQSPRIVFAAGAPLTERVANNYREKSGTIVQPLYGTTETGGISIAMNDREGLITGCVGQPMNGVQVTAQSTDDVDEHSGPASDTLQTLLVRSSSMMAGYLGPGLIDRSALVDGWFQTGDLSQLDPHGAIHLRGRITEVINVGGMKVIPREVEEVIAGIPGVSEVKVYAGISRSGTQFVKTAVVSDGSIDDKTIRERCGHELIYYKRPSAVLMVESLPKTPSGKVILADLP